MTRFFEGWRAVVDWLVSGLTLVCAAMCWVGASQTWAVGGPAWVIVTMALFGTLLLGGVLYLARSRKRL